MPEIDVTWLLPGGGGGGMGPDGPVRLLGALPGDRVRYTERSRQGRTVIGDVDEIVEPSPDRRAPPCPLTARCGGCDLDALRPEAQLRAKAALIQHALRLDSPPVVHPSPRPSGYRARIKLGISGRSAGYYAARSHELVPVPHCGIARSELNAALPPLTRWLTETGADGLAEVELRSDGERVVYVFSSSGDVPRAVRDAMSALGDVALDGRRIAGDPSLELRLPELTLRASPKAFYQVNLELNAALVRFVVERIERIEPTRILDLYAGIGNFALPLAHQTGVPVLAVESEGQAIEDLKHSAARAGLSEKVAAFSLPVERLDPSREAFDAVVLDPPRAGAPGVVDKLLRNRPRRLIYIACYAPSAARDLRPALQAGYVVSEVVGFDLFPDTHHVETVVVLDRGKRGPTPRKRSRERRRRGPRT